MFRQQVDCLVLLLSRALSSRLPKSILRLGETTSSIRLLVQHIVDLEGLPHEPHVGPEMA